MGLLDLFRGKPAAPAEPTRRRHGPGLRAMARAFETAFSGTNTDRLTASWPAQPMPADEIIRRHQRILVARARQQCTESGYARKFLRMCRQNIVGPVGITMVGQVKRADSSLDEEINTAIQEAFAEWGQRENCDVAGRKSWLNFELSSINNAAKDGEFMLRAIYGADAGPYGFALQWLDPQRCPPDYDVERWGNDGAFIRHGIECNRFGRVLAYHFTATNEGESEYTHGGRNYIRIPAAEIIHGFQDELGGQKRGLPWLATGLGRLRNITGTEDAAVVNARVGAAKMGFIQWKDGQGPELDEDDELTIDAEAGTFPVLPEGAELKEWAPQYPTGEFSPFMKHELRGLATGWGVLYNNLAGDLEGVNFSSIRQGTLDERERWKEDQEWLIECLHRQVVRLWLPYALLAGRIRVKGQALRPEKLAKYSAITWQPRRWTWIDPGADVKAAVDSKNNLLMSPGTIIREQARDPQTVYREIAQDIEAMRKAGIPDEFIPIAFGHKPVPPAPEKPENEKAA